jgi:hypothetical protein
MSHSSLAYVDFVQERLKDKNPDGSLQIMYTIHGKQHRALLLRGTLSRFSRREDFSRD